MYVLMHPPFTAFLLLTYPLDYQTIPQVDFQDLDKLKSEDIALIKQRGSLVIRNVVDDAEAAAWKTSLDEFVKANPGIKGMFALSPTFLRS